MAMGKEKLLTATEYGICLFSSEILQDFLRQKKIRSKKLLKLFQKDKELYLETQECGVWIPMIQVNSYEYVIRVDGIDEPFGDEWEQKIEYSGFNIEIKNGIWISGIGSMMTWKPEEYLGEEGSYSIHTPFGDMPHYYSREERYYQTLSGTTLYTDFHYDIPDGKYLLSVKGFRRKDFAQRTKMEQGAGACGFLFSFAEVEEFNGFENPREEAYDFNVGSME